MSAHDEAREAAWERGRLFCSRAQFDWIWEAALVAPPFCDQCSGPYDATWLVEGYGGHWDSCPNAVGARRGPALGSIQITRPPIVEGSREWLLATGGNHFKTTDAGRIPGTNERKDSMATEVGALKVTGELSTRPSADEFANTASTVQQFAVMDAPTLHDVITRDTISNALDLIDRAELHEQELRWRTAEARRLQENLRGILRGASTHGAEEASAGGAAAR